MLSFHVKFVPTDGQMDRLTTVKQYAPTFRYGGIKTSGCAVISLSNDKILDWSQLEAFADDKINVT